MSHTAHSRSLEHFSAPKGKIPAPICILRALKCHCDHGRVESRLLMVLPRLSDVKNNCGAGTHTRSRRLDRQNASIRCVCRSAGAQCSHLIHLCAALLFEKKKNPTHLVKIRPCDKWLWCQTFVTGCPDIWKKKKNAPQLLLDESESLSLSQRRTKWRHLGCLWNLSRCAASAEELWTFSLGGCRELKWGDHNSHVVV